MCQVWSASDVKIWLLPLEIGLVQVPVLCLRLLGCLTLALKNLQQKMISVHISVLLNSVYDFYINGADEELFRGSDWLLVLLGDSEVCKPIPFLLTPFTLSSFCLSKL